MSRKSFSITMAIHTSLIVSLGFLLLFTFATTNGLQCQICGQYNDGVGSITPCLNYSKENAHLHLKECPRKTDKFCVVSRLSLLFPRIFYDTTSGRYYKWKSEIFTCSMFNLVKLLLIWWWWWWFWYNRASAKRFVIPFYHDRFLKRTFDEIWEIY